MLFRSVLDAAMGLWHGGQVAFTDAYNPARMFAEKEAKARRGGAMIAMGAYAERCQLLMPLWDRRLRVAQLADTCSKWQDLLLAISQIPGFGGTGFAAQELALDILDKKRLGMLEAAS